MWCPLSKNNFHNNIFTTWATYNIGGLVPHGSHFSMSNFKPWKNTFAWLMFFPFSVGTISKATVLLQYVYLFFNYTIWRITLTLWTYLPFTFTIDQSSFPSTTVSSTRFLHIFGTPYYKGPNHSMLRPLPSSCNISKITSWVIFTFCPLTITLIYISSTLLIPLRKSYIRSSFMGAKCNLHSPFNPTIMAHLKSSSNSNQFFILQKGFIFVDGRLLLLSPSSFALAFPFLLALPSYFFTSVGLPINIFLIRHVSLCNWSIFLIVTTMASSLIALQILLLPFVATILFPPSCFPLKHLLSSLVFLICSLLVGWVSIKNQLGFYFLQKLPATFSSIFFTSLIGCVVNFFCSTKGAFPSSSSTL